MLIYQQNTNIVNIYVYASGASERRQIWHFLHTKRAHFFQYFVGTSDTWLQLVKVRLIRRFVILKVR